MQIQRIFELPAKAKVLIEFLWDGFSVLFAVLFAYWIRIGLDTWHFSPFRVGCGVC